MFVRVLVLFLFFLMWQILQRDNWKVEWLLWAPSWSFQPVWHTARYLWALLRAWLSQGCSLHGVQQALMKQAAARDASPSKGTPPSDFQAGPTSHTDCTYGLIREWNHSPLSIICQLGTKTSTHKLLGNKTYYLNCSIHTQVDTHCDSMSTWLYLEFTKTHAAGLGLQLYS